MSHDNDIPSIDGLDAAIGLELVEVTPDICVGRVQVGPVHRQPYGIVHGGTYCTIVEALASAGAAMWAMAKGMPGVVGLQNIVDPSVIGGLTPGQRQT